MKTRNLFLSLFAFAALCSCNKEAQPENPILGEDAYVAVTISSPSDAFTRGTSDSDDFEAVGSDAENKVTSATFIFFDGSDKVVDIQTIADFTNDSNWESGSDATPKTEVISKAVLVISAEKTIPEKMLVVLNHTVTGLTEGTSSLTDAIALVGSYNGQTEGQFVMSNSVYVDGGNVVNATAIPSSSIKTTADAAKEAPVNVYVERVLAKVKVGLAADAEKDSELKLNNGTVITYYPKYNGFVMGNLATSSYLVKNLSASYPEWDDWTTWNDAPNYRSYWANCPDFSYENPYDLTDASVTDKYCFENTKSRTEIVVGAKLMNTNGTVDKGDDTALDIVKYLGEYWLYSDYVAEALSLLSSYKKIGDVALAADDLEPKSTGVKSYEIKLALKDGVTLIGGETAKTEVNAKLAAMEVAWHWNDGSTYYFTDIKHFGTDAGKNDYAVVRNHIYSINITKIKGLGTPVADPEKPIDPEKPTDLDYYLAAKVNILQWKVVSQDVSFGE